MQSAGFCKPAGATASPSNPFRPAPPAGQAKKLSSLDDEQLELTERDLWEDEADLSEEEEQAVLASTSAPNPGLGHSNDTEAELESPSPDIKAFHGDTKSHQCDRDPKSADQTAEEDTDPEHSGRGNMEQHRLSTDSASAMPIGRFPQHQSRRPPLRANSTYASRIGMHPRATVKMGSSAPINIPIMSRLPSIRGDDAEDAAKKPFVPPHLLGESKKGDSLQQFSMMAGVSVGASVKSKKLQQRNAILRSTGFIEEAPHVKGVGEVLDPIKEGHLEFFHSRSKLTEALGTSPHVGSSS